MVSRSKRRPPRDQVSAASSAVLLAAMVLAAAPSAWASCGSVGFVAGRPDPVVAGAPATFHPRGGQRRPHPAQGGITAERVALSQRPGPARCRDPIRSFRAARKSARRSSPSGRASRGRSRSRSTCPRRSARTTTFWAFWSVRSSPRRRSRPSTAWGPWSSWTCPGRASRR